MPLYPINRNLADVVAQDKIEDRVKVINLQRSITAYIEKNIAQAPYLATLSEEVAEVVERLRQQQISVQTALAELQAKADQAVATGEERAGSRLDDLAFALRTGLRASPALSALPPADLDTLAEDIAAYLQTNHGWPHNDRLEQQVRLEMYRRLLVRMSRPANPQQARAVVDDLLRMHRITLA